jgi:uncharacterized protein YbjT (DUF2867 family)
MSSSSAPPIAVFGATGEVGRRVCAELARDGDGGGVGREGRSY